MPTKIRKGQAPATLSRQQFGARYAQQHADLAYATVGPDLARVETIAWEAYADGRKAPVTHAAGAAFAKPGYQASVEWLGTRARLKSAESTQKDPRTSPRVLVICGSPRNDGTCPGEMSKSFRIAHIAIRVLKRAGIDTDLLDLSLVTSDYGRNIHPCKGCASTAMPLCHWPCSCYPNHSLGQTNDWMAEIYERWTAAHGVLIVTPVHWYQAPSVLKLMIDRLVCADGGNPDLTSTSGKNAAEAKALELSGWAFPKHLAGRVYGLVVHGDVAGTERVRSALADWLDWMGLIAAGTKSQLDRYIGYYEPYATSHDALDRDTPVQDEVRLVAKALAAGVKMLRQGKLAVPAAKEPRPRPK